MKDLGSYKGVIIFLLVLTFLNFIPTNKGTSTEYVKGTDEIEETEVAINF